MNTKLQLVQHKETLVVSKEEIPVAPPGGLVIKTAYCGICHSDLHLWEKSLSPFFTMPRVLGHEISGRIFSISKGAKEENPELEEGTDVVAYPWVGCNACGTCEGGGVLCPSNLGFLPTNPTLNHNLGVFIDGGFQEYVVIPSPRQVIPVSGIPLDAAALCPCSGVTAYNAVTSLRYSVENAIKFKGEAKILQVGAGGLSLWALQINKAVYGDKIKLAVVDISEDKMGPAKEAGADVTVVWDPKASPDDGISAVREACAGNVDAVIDFTGLTATAERVFYLLNPGATWSIVGLYGGTMPSLPLFALAYCGIRIQGIFVGTRKQAVEVIKLLKDGKIQPPPIEHVTLEQVEEVFDKVRNAKQKGRAIIKF